MNGAESESLLRALRYGVIEKRWLERSDGAGKVRCTICCRVLRNSRTSVVRHFSKEHPAEWIQASVAALYEFSSQRKIVSAAVVDKFFPRGEKVPFPLLQGKNLKWYVLK